MLITFVAFVQTFDSKFETIFLFDGWDWLTRWKKSNRKQNKFIKTYKWWQKYWTLCQKQPPHHLSQWDCVEFGSLRTQPACHFLWDSEGPQTVLVLLLLQHTPTLWQATPEGGEALHLGCPNASSEALERGTCFWTQVPLWPKLQESSSSSKHTSRGNKIAWPPVFTAEGRGQREGMSLLDAISRKWLSVCQRWDTNVTEETVCMK